MVRLVFIAVLSLLGSAWAQSQPLPSEIFEKDKPYGGHPRQLIDITARPIEGKAKPAVLFVHGGSWQSGDKRSAQNKESYFLKEGMQVATMNYRLVPEVTPREQAMDVAAAAVWLARNAENYGINPREIYLVGHGSGAHLVTLVATDPSFLAPYSAQPEDLGGVIALDSGAYDVPKAMTTNGEDTVYGRTLRQVFGPNRDLWPGLSPAYNTDKADGLPPFFIVHSENRKDVYAQARPLTTALRKNGAAAIIYEAAGRDTESIYRFFGTEGDELTEAAINFIRRESNLPVRFVTNEQGNLIPEVPWSMAFEAPGTDKEGLKLSGTQINEIVTHEGRLFAGSGNKNDTRERPRGQVFRLDSREDRWALDFQMPVQYTDVTTMMPMRFNVDFEGRPIEPLDYLLVGSTFRKGAGKPGPAGVFIRTPSSNWTKQDLGISRAALDETHVSALGKWRDRETGIDLVFVGSGPAPLGIFRGAYNAGEPGGIEFDPVPEFEVRNDETVVGFAECGDALYAATDQMILRRRDGEAARWEVMVDFYDLTAFRPYLDDLDIYWQRNYSIGSFRCDVSQSQPMLAFTALNRAFKYKPGDKLPVMELNIVNLIKSELGREAHFVQAMKPAMMRKSGRNTEEWIGIEVYYDLDYLSALPEFPFWRTGFGKDAWYLVRKVDRGVVSYRLEELVIPGIDPNLRPLARITDFERSPFDQDNAVYVGGFTPWFEDVTNTAWIARGEL